MDDLVAYDVRVRGVVQGVSFRWHAQRRASALGVSGWVSNEPGGSVRAHVEGPREDVEQMLSWLAHGPVAAAVDDVESTGTTVRGLTGFEVAG